MISHDKKCIFIHIPKCGGTSVEDVIWPKDQGRTEQDLWMGFVTRFENKYQTGGLQHLLAWQVRQEVGSDAFDSYYKFTFVRNPWDRIVSQFAFMQRRPDLMEYLGMKSDTEFKSYLELIRLKEHVQWTPQVRFFLDQDGSVLVDRIGRLESFGEDCAQVFAALGLKAGLLAGHANRSKRQSFQHYYSDREAIEMVADIFAEDIEFLGYKFVDPSA
ncbi:sulfotransferase family 2 domain-containing protein [Synechococcus sp. MU1648]|uniref:sulfotransferase family 2 domain-containing protein n=1 Tax=unclassified Synechococcus TaxID=2626047 RepID=UPI001CF803FB